ncbi:hypothetical protein JCM8202_006166 [Rhodotorula sphaerocarpa]
MARWVECASPEHAGLNEAAPTGSASPHSASATGSSRSSPASSSGAIRAVNPSPAPAVRTLRLSTRPQTPSQLKGLACAPLSPAERRPSYRRAPDSPAISQHSPAVNSLASDARTGAQRSHRRIASEPMLSRAFKAHAVTARERRGDGPDAQQPATPFDFRRATSDGLSRSTDALPRSYSSPILHTPKRLLKEPKKKTRTPRRDRAAYASAGGLVKSVLGLAAKSMKGLALSTAQGRRRLRFGHKAGKTRAGPQDAETDWLDEAGWLRAQKQAQKPKHPRHSSTTGARSKRKRVSDESTRSREHRSSASRPPPKTPRSSSSRRSPGSKSTKQASSGGGGGGGASTFRASSSHKRTRVSYGRLYRSASSSLPHPCPTSEAPSRILSRARPVPRSEAQVGEYSARATLPSSLRSELGRSGYSVHGDLRAMWDKGAEECSGDEEEWVEEPLLVDDFGNVAQYLDSEADLLPFSDPGPMQVPPARPRFYRSLAPSPISTRGLRLFSAGRPASPSSIVGEAPGQADPEQDLSHRIVADGDGSLRDESDASPLTQFVRELARAQSSSHDGDAEDGSDESEAEAVDSPRETDSGEVTSPRSTTRFQLERWLPFQFDGRGANWLGRESSPSDHETQATDVLCGSAPSLRRSPHIKSLTRRSAESVDLASAQVVGARRLSRELVRKTSLAGLRRSRSSAGTVSAPVSPIACSEGSTVVIQSVASSSSPTAVPAAAGLVPASPQTPGSLGAASGADRAGTAQSAASSRLPSLSPVSPLKVSFRSEGSGGSSPLAASSAAAPKVENSPADAAEQSVRHLARASAGFSLPVGSTYAAALRQTALSVFRFPEPESTGSVRVPAAEGEGQLRRTIRPGTRERGSWEVFRDGIEAREGATAAAGVRGTGKAAGGVEPGVLVERTTASFLRRQVSIATQTGSTRGSTSSTLEDKENAPC